ncbi:MAG: RDD family protein [Dehalococcoidales bacterium]
MEQRPASENPGNAQQPPEIILSPAPSGAPSGRTGSAVNKVCPNCGNVNPPESVFCFKCGLKLPDYVNQDKKICIGCQTPNAASAQYCYKCGLKLPDTLGSFFAMRYAGFWVRLLASLIDSLLLGVFASIITIPLTIHYFGQFSDTSSLSSIENTSESTFLIFYLIFTLVVYGVQIAYSTIAVGKWGKTVGKAALGLKVVKPDGSRVSYWRAFGRSLAYQLNGFTMGLTFLMIAFTPKKRGLHDYIADTVVIKTN